MDEKDQDEDLISSEEYEEKANECLGKHPRDNERANAYATLALVATIREASFLFAEILDSTEEE